MTSSISTIEQCQKTVFQTSAPGFFFSIYNALQPIWNAIAIGKVGPDPAPTADGAFGAVDANRDNELTDHFHSK